MARSNPGADPVNGCARRQVRIPVNCGRDRRHLGWPGVHFRVRRLPAEKDTPDIPTLQITAA